jgi:hypothetical protein
MRIVLTLRVRVGRHSRGLGGLFLEEDFEAEEVEEVCFEIEGKNFMMQEIRFKSEGERSRTQVSISQFLGEKGESRFKVFFTGSMIYAVREATPWPACQPLRDFLS